MAYRGEMEGSCLLGYCLVATLRVWEGKHLYDWQETQLASTGCKEYSTYSMRYLRGGLRPVVVLPKRRTMTWWTIGMLLLTNFLTIYIYFSHTLAGVVTTSLTILYLPSNPLQPCSIACASFWIITRLLTLICWWFLWPYSHWNASPLPRHSLISSTCINRLLECDQSLKLGLLWVLDLQSLTVSDLLSFIKTQNPHLHLRMYPKVC